MSEWYMINQKDLGFVVHTNIYRYIFFFEKKKEKKTRGKNI